MISVVLGGDGGYGFTVAVWLAVLTVTTQIGDLGMVDVCPSCGGLSTGRTLGRSTRAGRAGGSSGVELRRCGSCRRLAQRPAGMVGGWTDAGLDPSLDYLSDYTVQPVPPPWVVVAPQHRAALETELRAEVADGHAVASMIT